MDLSTTETPLHDLARSGTKDQWTELISLFGKEQESLFAIKFHLNRRDELRYTPFHAAIFARYHSNFYNTKHPQIIISSFSYSFYFPFWLMSFTLQELGGS